MLDVPAGYSVSVAAIVRDDAGRALLVRRRDNRAWEPPGGALEPGENLEAGALREVFEETGLTVELGPLTGVYFNTTRKVAAHVWSATPSGGRLQSNSEATEFRWADAPEINRLVAPTYAIRYLDARNFTGTPAERWHDGTRLTRTATTWRTVPAGEL